MLAPIVARPMASAIGRPLARLLGISGKLGRENSMRSPRRTAQTSSALMVGLALVSTIAVFGASLSKSATSSVDNAVSADYIITSSGQAAPAGSATRWPAAAARVPGVTAVSTVYSGQFEFRRALSNLTAVSTDHLPDTVILRMDSGAGAPALAAGQLLIDTTTANTKHLSVGSVRAGEVRADRDLDHADRRDLQAQRPARQLPGRGRLSSCPISTTRCPWRCSCGPTTAARLPPRRSTAG